MPASPWKNQPCARHLLRHEHDVVGGLRDWRATRKPAQQRERCERGSAARSRSCAWSRLAERRCDRQRVLCHERAIDPVLPAPDPVAFGDERAARGDRVPAAGGDQRERVSLRHVACAAARRARRAAGWRRAAGPGAPRRRPTWDADGRSATRSRRPRTRTGATSSAGDRRCATKPASSQASPDSASHGARGRGRRPDDAVDGDAPAVRDDDRARLDRVAPLDRCSTTPRSTRMRPNRARTGGAMLRQHAWAGR